VFCIRGNAVSAELFDSPPSYSAAVRSSACGYAVEVLNASVSVPPPLTAAAFLRRVCGVTPAICPPTGVGTQLRFDDLAIVGAALVHDGRVVHLTATHA
jgi:hypothetical protein